MHSWKHHSSRKITEVKQLRAMVSTGMGDRSRIEVDAVVKNTVKLLGRKHKIENNMF